MKVILSGGPCSGKSSLLEEIGKMGYNTLEEVARKVLTERNGEKLGKNEQELRQREIYRRQLDEEKRIDKRSITFLDRSKIDVIAYCKFFGIDFGFVNIDLREYDLVFFLEALPFEDDGLRIETAKEAGKISNILLETYTKLGFEVVLVPVMPLDERADFVINHINCLKGGVS